MASLNNDNILDVFDLCQMRKAVLLKIKTPAAVSITETGGYKGVNRTYKVYEENGKFIMYYYDLKGIAGAEPIITEITKEEYSRIMAQDYERSSPTHKVMDGFNYKSVITYQDGTEKTTNADMYDIILMLEKLLVQYNDGVIIW